jgi:protocatechuate 3,4-dioxygenase alpha subunit
MAKLRQTPSQTVGPYFAYGLAPEQYGYQQTLTSIAGSQMAADDTEGQHIRVEGRVFDGAGNPISDALIEIWQADSLGRYAHPSDPRGSNSTFKGLAVAARERTRATGFGSIRSSRAASPPGMRRI